MTFAKSDAFTGRFGRRAQSRIELALSHAISDSQTRSQVVPFGSSEVKVTAVDDYFATLLTQEGCEDAWTAYTNATDAAGFPQQLAQGTAPLNGFRHYTLQDAIYLDYYVRVRMAAIGTWDSKVSLADLQAFVAKIPSSLAYAENTRSICQTQLGVPEAAIDDEWNNHKSTQLETSVSHYESIIATDIQQNGNAWLDIYFALLPCIKGYYEIAKALLQNPTTDRNTLYYSLWIVPNADPSYAEAYEKFIKDNIGNNPTSDQWARWGTIFKESCVNEKNFFDLAISDYAQYDIVSAGAYTLSPYANASLFLAPDEESGVTVSNTSTQWTLTNSKDGYSVKLDDNKYLGVDDQQKVVIKDDDSTKWSINPVFIPEKKTYQLFLFGVAKALDVDGTYKVSVAKNDPTTQTWILTAVQE